MTIRAAVAFLLLAVLGPVPTWSQTQCSGTVVIDLAETPYGVIQTPDPYDGVTHAADGNDCRWEFHNTDSVNWPLILQLTDMLGEVGWDFLEVNGGPHISVNVTNRVGAPIILPQTSDVVTVRYFTDPYVSSLGFRMIFGRQLPECPYISTLPPVSGSVFSYPTPWGYGLTYPNDFPNGYNRISCYFQVTAPVGMAVLFQLMAFDLADTDWLKIMDGHNLNDLYYEIYYQDGDSSATPTVLSNQENATITFDTVSLDFPGTGFQMSYEFVSQPTDTRNNEICATNNNCQSFNCVDRICEPECQSNNTINIDERSSGSFSFPNSGRTYSHDANCDWTLISPSSSTLPLYFSFPFIDIEPCYDFITISNPAYLDGFINVSPGCPTFVQPDDVPLTDGGTVAVSWSSDHNVSFTGFTLAWASTLPLCAEVSAPVSIGVTPSLQYPVRLNEGLGYTTGTAYTCQWTIIAPEGFSVQTSFAFFVLQDDDRLLLEDTGSGFPPLVISPSSSPDPVVSLGPSLTITFQMSSTANTIGDAGFRLLFSQVVPPVGGVGSPCVSDSNCPSNSTCADGVCCSTPCNGPCVTCTLSGECIFDIEDTFEGGPCECDSYTEVCGTFQACPTTFECAPASCVDGMFTEATYCSGAPGGCPSPSPATACPGSSVCNDEGTACTEEQAIIDSSGDDDADEKGWWIVLVAAGGGVLCCLCVIVAAVIGWKTYQATKGRPVDDKDMSSVYDQDIRAAEGTGHTTVIVPKKAHGGAPHLQGQPPSSLAGSGPSSPGASSSGFTTAIIQKGSDEGGGEGGGGGGGTRPSSAMFTGGDLRTASPRRGTPLGGLGYSTEFDSVGPSPSANFESVQSDASGFTTQVVRTKPQASQRSSQLPTLSPQEAANLQFPSFTAAGPPSLSPSASPIAASPLIRADQPPKPSRGQRPSLAPPPPLTLDFSKPVFPGCEDAEALSRGGQGVVFSAFSLALGEVICIKAFFEKSMYDREISILQAIPPHPNIIEVLDVSPLPSNCIPIKLATLGSLMSYLGQFEGARSPAVIALAVDIARALQHVHSVGVAHLDVKPGNVLVTTTASGHAQAVLTDFGASFLKGRTDLRIDMCSMRYAAPEVMAILQGATMKAAGVLAYTSLDVYSFGVSLWEMVTGLEPHAGLNPAEILALYSRAPDSYGVDVNCVEHAGLREVISLCLRGASARPRTMDEVLTQLTAMWE